MRNEITPESTTNKGEKKKTLKPCLVAETMSEKEMTMRVR